MKILVVCQHYWPEPYPLADICQELVRRGHTVDVITGVPNYPMGYIYPEYRRGKNRRQVHEGVTIMRTFTIGRRKNLLFRFLNYYSYAISSTLYVKRLKEEYDVVFTNQTSPVMMSSAALAYAKKWGKKCVLYCMDLWPASLKIGGIGERNPVYRYFTKVSRRIYNQADTILITSQMFRDYLRDELGVDEEKIHHLPQSADARFSQELPPQAEKETIDLVFAGNVGKAQSMPTILGAAARLRDIEGLRWHIVGDGTELESTRKQAHEMGLKNIIFHGRKPMEEMPVYYAMADAMLVCLTADPVVSLTLPGKVQTYMAAGKPILAASNGEIARVISDSKCGFCAAAEDAEGLAEAVRQFLAAEDKNALGMNASWYFTENYAKERFMSKLEDALEQVQYSRECREISGLFHVNAI